MITALALMLMATQGGSVEREGMRFEWRIEGDVLTGTVSAPTTGWVTVGFNRPQAGLPGARLIMTRVDREGRVEVEEHLADPPHHAPVKGSTVSVVRGAESKGHTAVTFRMKLPAGLAAGQPVHLVLAYSADDDFQHHSRMRTSVETTL